MVDCRSLAKVGGGSRRRTRMLMILRNLRAQTCQRPNSLVCWKSFSTGCQVQALPGRQYCMRLSRHSSRRRTAAAEFHHASGNRLVPHPSRPPERQTQRALHVQRQSSACSVPSLLAHLDSRARTCVRFVSWRDPQSNARYPASRFTYVLREAPRAGRISLRVQCSSFFPKRLRRHCLELTQKL